MTQKKINKISKKHEKHISTKALAIVGTILIGFVLSYFEIKIASDNNREYIHWSLKNIIDSCEYEYNNNFNKSELYYESNIRCMEDLAGIAAYTIGKNGYSKDSMEEIETNLEQYTTVHFFEGTIDENQKKISGRMVDSTGVYTLSDMDYSIDALYTAITEGRYYAGEDIIVAKRISTKRYVVLSSYVDDLMIENSILSSYSSDNGGNIIRIDKETGIIDDSTIEDFVGQKYDYIIDLSDGSDFDGSINVKKLYNGKYAYVVADEDDNGNIFVGYTEFKDNVFNIFRNIMLPLVLGWIFLIMVAIYVLRFLHNHRDVIKDDEEYIKLAGHYYIDRKLGSHIVATTVLAVVLIILSMIYVQTLVNHSNQNMMAAKELQSLEHTLDINQSNYKAMVDDWKATQGIVVDCISTYYMRHPDQLSGDSLSVLAEYLPYVDTIDVTDKSGTIVYDSGIANTRLSYDTQIGYTLSNDSDAEENVCYDVLRGTKKNAAYPKNAASSDFYVVGRRQDQDGVIRIKTNAEMLYTFKELTSYEMLVGVSFFGDSCKGYIDKENPAVIHWFGVNDESSRAIDNVLPEKAISKNFAGVVKINGGRYYVNSEVDEANDIVVLCAKRQIELNGISNYVALIIVIMVFVLQNIFFTVIGSYRFDNQTDVKYKFSYLHESINDRMMDYHFRKIVRNMVFSTFIIIALLLAIEALYNENSLLSYLFTNDWEKGINLFSATQIVLLGAVSIISGKLLKSLILFFTQNMGPRGVTIGRMLGSLMNFVILITVVVIVMIDLGVNPTVLLTGAGVVGVAFSLCAQQTVNDFLSGFFIVFEGTFNIGDWVKVNDFRGQVIEIGVRVTKIAKGGEIRVINNSELKQVHIMAPNGQGAVCLIDIAYKEDVNKVIDLIIDNKSVYEENIPFMLEGPYVDGVTSLGDSGVTLYIWALAEQEKVNALERSVYRVTKNLFDEYGIEIPFNQVTIHKAE